jgi:hypothetical protein
MALAGVDVAETLVGWLAFFSFLVGVAALQALNRLLILFAEAMPNTWSSAATPRTQGRDLGGTESNLMADGGQKLAFREKIRGNDATDPSHTRARADKALGYPGIDQMN